MIKRFNYRTMLWVLVTLIFISTLTAMAAGNTIPTTRLDENTAAMNANAIKPAACSALNLTAIVICSGVGICNGTGANELILGTPADQRIRGRGGTDCIVGGDGNDDLIGNNGGDICIGGPGTDTFTTCETRIQ
jgi:Ca2+-binding RTX toxin-like protein